MLKMLEKAGPKILKVLGNLEYGIKIYQKT